jgi:hypothetical protein
MSFIGTTLLAESRFSPQASSMEGEDSSLARRNRLAARAAHLILPVPARNRLVAEVAVR